MKFSVVIPCYKSADTLAKCIGSILDQDFKDYEIICVFDGPDKKAQAIAESFDNVKVEVIEHGGVQKARNHGLTCAKGDFVMFSDCDMFWYSGSFRSYAEKLDETGADFAYSGYRWEDGRVAHIPPEFDAHLIETFNIVDAANPIRRTLVEKVGGWDPEIKRFQDWDLWIRCVRAGGVGVKLAEDITRTTLFPTGKSISGQDNYKSSFEIVAKKHNLRHSDVLLTSIAAKGHALRIAKLCGWDYWQNPDRLPKDYKAVYILGMFPESIEDHLMLLKSKKDARMIVHWIGTDVLHMQTMIPYINAKALRTSFKKHNIKSFVQSEQNAEEMRELGFEVEVLPLPVYSKMPLVPLPKEFTVACYDHGGVDQKWHKWLCIEITKSMPDVKFLFYGNKNAVGIDRNMEWVGHKPIEEVIKKSSCLMRLTVHDGYPVAPIEFMYSGRKVITNVPDMKFTEFMKVGVINDSKIPAIKKMLFDLIRKVQDDPELKNVQEIKDHYEAILDADKFKKRIQEVIDEKS
jgi:glycosyltransferase involved in cell wall biosynthesis